MAASRAAVLQVVGGAVLLVWLEGAAAALAFMHCLMPMPASCTVAFERVYAHQAHHVRRHGNSTVKDFYTELRNWSSTASQPFLVVLKWHTAALPPAFVCARSCMTWWRGRKA